MAPVDAALVFLAIAAQGGLILLVGSGVLGTSVLAAWLLLSALRTVLAILTEQAAGTASGKPASAGSSRRSAPAAAAS